MTSGSVDKILAGLPLPVMLIDAEYRITKANPLLQDLFGRDIEGLNAQTLLRQAPVLAALDTALIEGQKVESEFVFNAVEGESRYVLVVSPLMDGAAISGAVLSFQDITEAEASETIRRDFVANISHELRTPLTALTGFIETLRSTARDDPEASDRFLSIMDSEAQRMSRMVSDLLSLSRVEADSRVRPRSEVNLSVVLRSVLATLEGRLAEAGVTVSTDGLEKPAKIKGDADQLIQLLLNLIENAIKYGGSDRTIHVTLMPLDHDTALRVPAYQIDIRDEGEGIDAIHLPRLTERFYRVDDHRNREMGGTGLGLAIAKHITYRHRGRLKIQSEQGVGSCVSVILPAAATGQ